MTDPSDPQRDYEALRGGLGFGIVDDIAIFRVRGHGAGAALDEIAAGPVERLVENSILWTAILDERGGLAADVQLYNDFGEYVVTCGRERREAVQSALAAAQAADVEVEDRTEALAVVAIEGPDALDLPAAIAGAEASGLPSLRFIHCTVDGADLMVGRIGYSGEFSYLLFAPADKAGALCDRIRETAPQAVPCGRAVQDLLRLEMRLPNHRRDFPRGETALQAGLHWMINFRKPAFIGREAVLVEKAAGLGQRLVCFVASTADPLPVGTELFVGESKAGYVANAAWSPGADRQIGLAYVDSAHAWVGVELGRAGGPDVRLVSAPFITTESVRRAAQ